MSDCEYTQVSCLGVINSDSLERRAEQNRLLKSDERERKRENAQTEGKHNLCSRIITHTHIQYASESDEKSTSNNH